jgi:hypothetical protein
MNESHNIGFHDMDELKKLREENNELRMKASISESDL